MAVSVTGRAVHAEGADEGSRLIVASTPRWADRACHLPRKAVQSVRTLDRGEVGVWAHIPWRAKRTSGTASKSIRSRSARRDSNIIVEWVVVTLGAARALVADPTACRCVETK